MADYDRLLADEPVTSLEDYVQGDGGLGYAHALELEPEDVIDIVSRSGLRGRGGAGFPTAKKWQGVRATADETGSTTYLVCNGAEGEPGTYKDRVLLEHNPYAVLEGMLIGMYAVGAERGFLGVKEKFAGPVEAAIRARDEMVDAGWQRADAVAIVPGPDEYLFGEEKAMLEVVEGKLPLPRILPPYELGLFATMAAPNPTVVNNVESFAHVTRILTNGPEWFREFGTEGSPGTMVFTVVGDVESPGWFELPLGTPLRTLVEDIAGARDVKAVYSGTSNTVITPSMLDTPMDFDAMTAAGSGLGSAGFIVYDSNRCIVSVLRTLQRFLAIESCGQCLACKLGTSEMYDRLDRIERGQGTEEDVEAIVGRVQSVTDQTRCYLAAGSQLMVGSTLEEYADEFGAHLGRTCPDDRDVPVPLIEHIDPDNAEVTYHPRYHLKQMDWSYADET